MTFDRQNFLVGSIVTAIVFIAFCLIMRSCGTTIKQTCPDGSTVEIHQKWTDDYRVRCD